MIQIDKHYYYKGNEYVVTGFCRVKTLSGEWVDGVPYTADYYYQLANMRERMKNSAIIDKMVSALSTAATRVQDIPASNTTYSLEESLKSIQQTLDVIYNKFGV